MFIKNIVKKKIIERKENKNTINILIFILN